MQRLRTTSYVAMRPRRTSAERDLGTPENSNVRVGRRLPYVRVATSATCAITSSSELIDMPETSATVVQPPPTAFDGAVYAELKRIAQHHLRTRADNATLCTTDLVHEAYLKLGAMPAADAENDSPWQSRGHFFGAASRAMRQVLVDYARQRQAAKRGGGARAITLTGKHAEVEVRVDELLVLDEALDKLRALDERLCRVVELRYFAGLGDAEVAECLGVTLRTVGRDWVKARLFLSRELAHD